MKTSAVDKGRRSVDVMRGNVDAAAARSFSWVEELTNDTGADILEGSVVVVLADGTIALADTENDPRPTGVVVDQIDDADTGQVVLGGPVDLVLVTSSVTAGQYGQTSTTPGEAQVTGAVARAFCEFTSSGTEPSAFLWGGRGGGGIVAGVNIEDFPTSETDTTLVLHPVGDGTVAWGVDATGGLPWFNVTDYGAVGDGTTDDTTAVNLAIAALNAADCGVLYFPCGTYKVTGALTAIAVGCTVVGDGKAGFDGSTGVSQINCTSATAALFTFQPTEVEQMTVRDLALANTAASTPSAGAAIVVTSSDGLGRVDLESVSVHRFYDNVDIQGVGWTIRNCWITHPVRYGVRIRNDNLVDGGDWSVSDTGVFAGTYDSDAGIHMEASGGGKFVNVKVNRDGPNGAGKAFNHGIEVAIPTGVSTSVLAVDGCSIENVRGDAIKITTTGTGRFGSITLSGNQVGLYSNNSGRAVNINAASTGGKDTNGGIGNIVIDGGVFSTDGTARAAISLTNTDGTTLGSFSLVGFNARYTSSGDTNLVDMMGASGSVATDAIWDAAGDLAVATGADTAAKLAIGAAGAALSVYNGAVRWNSGTSFPASPAAGDRFWRTDMLLEAGYDGTRWLSIPFSNTDMQLSDVASVPIAVGSIPATVFRSPLLNGSDIYITSIYYWFYVAGTNNGSNYYTFAFSRQPSGTALVSVGTSAVAANTHLQLVGSVNALTGTTDKEVEVYVDKVGTPGSLYIAAKFLWHLKLT